MTLSIVHVGGPLEEVITTSLQMIEMDLHVRGPLKFNSILELVNDMHLSPMLESFRKS